MKNPQPFWYWPFVYKKRKSMCVKAFPWKEPAVPIAVVLATNPQPTRIWLGFIKELFESPSSISYFPKSKMTLRAKGQSFESMAFSSHWLFTKKTRLFNGWVRIKSASTGYIAELLTKWSLRSRHCEEFFAKRTFEFHRLHSNINSFYLQYV